MDGVKKSQWIKEALEKHGALTVHQMSEMTGWDRDNLYGIMRWLKKINAVHIKSYIRSSEGQEREAARAVYVLGPGKHAKKPKAYNNAQNSKRWRAQRKQKTPAAPKPLITDPHHPEVVKTDWVEWAIGEHGDLTQHEIVEMTGWGKKHVAKILHRLRTAKPKRIYVKEFIRSSEGQVRDYPRAVYCVGAKEDAPRLPRLTGTEMSTRYRNKLKGTANSIFAVAALVHVNRRAGGRKPTQLPFNWEHIRKVA